MIIVTYSHRCGQSVIPSALLQDVMNVIKDINPQARINTVSTIRDSIIKGLDYKGWSGEYRLDALSKITITSFLNNIGLCLQTGNVSRVYADLLKLQSLYIKGNIQAGIIVLPQKVLALKLASNMANYERLIGELPIFNQVITMPLFIIGFNVEENSNV